MYIYFKSDRFQNRKLNRFIYNVYEYYNFLVCDEVLRVCIRHPVRVAGARPVLKQNASSDAIHLQPLEMLIFD